MIQYHVHVNRIGNLLIKKISRMPTKHIVIFKKFEISNQEVLHIPVWLRYRPDTKQTICTIYYLFDKSGRWLVLFTFYIVKRKYSTELYSNYQSHLISFHTNYIKGSQSHWSVAVHRNSINWTTSDKTLRAKT